MTHLHILSSGHRGMLPVFWPVPQAFLHYQLQLLHSVPYVQVAHIQRCKAKAQNVRRPEVAHNTQLNERLLINSHFNKLLMLETQSAG